MVVGSCSTAAFGHQSWVVDAGVLAEIKVSRSALMSQKAGFGKEDHSQR